MKKVITNDGSLTFYNKEFDDIYHSRTGALEEAFEKFAKPCKLKNGMKVLDICFGLGYNSLAAISLANVDIIALEIDKAILEKIKNNNIFNNKNNNYNIKNNYKKIKTAAKNFEYEDSKISLKIMLGDARETIKTLNEKFDVVFLDPFSPKKHKELWTEEFFSEIKKKMNKNAILATYSCAKIIRNNFINAGFFVKDGPCIGRRSPCTLAYP